jgi:aspartate kinase
MKVFKFGGASVKNSDAVRNVADILKAHEREKILVVISAMGKTTNALEKVVDAWFKNDPCLDEYFDAVKKFHLDIIKDLFPFVNYPVYIEIGSLFEELQEYLENPPSANYDYEYDQVVSFGELFSTLITSHYLNERNIPNRLFDARDMIKTGNNFRDAEVDWIITTDLVKQSIGKYFHAQVPRVAITQGFIGSTIDQKTVTLGREGSDYTAAILANILDAESVTIWKDVPGLLNADPKFFPDTKKLDYISYREAIELAYYGATIIHPKTIKPLENKHIPLFVKSFLEPDSNGSIIHSDTGKETDIPSYIFKRNQVLLTITPRDFSFIDEKNLSHIIGVFAKNNAKINLMQNSAISFSVCMDFRENKLSSVLNELHTNYIVRFNEDLELITIRHYDQPTIDRLLEGKNLLLEQKSRVTAQLVVK